MKTILQHLLVVALAGLGSSAAAQPFPVRQEYLFFPARIDGHDYQLEAMLYRPDDALRHPLVVFSHGRNGPNPARDPNTVNSYPELCRALAGQGHVVAYFVRRGYGNSEGPDTELQDTAVLSGLEAAKDYAGALAYWRGREFVRPGQVVLMGQSQGGWDVLACTNVAMEGVLGVVNISGGTNYRLMGNGAVTSAVQDHWVEASGELGAHDLVPSYWIYSENDQSISGPTARRMFSAFTAAGGLASMLMLPPFGSNGHNIVSQPALFLTQVENFFAVIGFLDESPPGPAPLTAAPAILAQPSNQGVLSGGNATFAVMVAGNPTPNCQWQRQPAGSSIWSNLAEGGSYRGVFEATLTVSATTTAMSGDQFRCVAASIAGSVTSGSGSLTVTPSAAPAPTSGSSRGGGGAPSGWFVAALALLTAARWAGNRRPGISAAG